MPRRDGEVAGPGCDARFDTREMPTSVGVRRENVRGGEPIGEGEGIA